MNIRTLIYKNYLINRNFNFNCFKEDFNIKVIKIIKKVKSN